MYLLPAIDILGGKAVRLAKGDYDRVTVYHGDPAAQAQLFEEQGATWLHVVDLDGARSGTPENIGIVERIMRKTLLKVEVGGGVRSLDTIARLADAGVSRVVLGTSLVADPDFAEAAIAQYGKLLCAGIDAKGGEVAVAGWREGAPAWTTSCVWARWPAASRASSRDAPCTRARCRCRRACAPATRPRAEPRPPPSSRTLAECESNMFGKVGEQVLRERHCREGSTKRALGT